MDQLMPLRHSPSSSSSRGHRRKPLFEGAASRRSQNGATFVHVVLNQPRCRRGFLVSRPLCLVAVAVEAGPLSHRPVAGESHAGSLLTGGLLWSRRTARAESPGVFRAGQHPPRPTMPVKAVHKHLTNKWGASVSGAILTNRMSTAGLAYAAPEGRLGATIRTRTAPVHAHQALQRLAYAARTSTTSEPRKNRHPARNFPTDANRISARPPDTACSHS